MNGFYQKEGASLKNGFTPPKNQVVQPVDQRLYDGDEMFNQKNQNFLYKPNEELLVEIEKAQKMREYQRTKRNLEGGQFVEQQVEEISPSGRKRYIGHQSNNQELLSISPNRTSQMRDETLFQQSTGKRHQNPFADNEQAQKDMYAVNVVRNQSQNMLNFDPSSKNVSQAQARGEGGSQGENQVHEDYYQQSQNRMHGEPDIVDPMDQVCRQELPDRYEQGQP